MKAIEIVYLICSGGLVLAGLGMVGAAIRAYVQTERKAMIHLSIGFALIVAAASATTISAFLNDFQNPRTLLTINYFVTTVGFGFVMFSLVSE